MIYIKNGVAYEDYSDKNYFFVCQCCSTSHYFALTFWDYEQDQDDNGNPKIPSSAYIVVPEKHYLSFWGKCVSVVKYFFGKNIEYAGTMLRHCDIPKINGLLGKYSDYLRETAASLNINIPFETVPLYENELLLIDPETSRTIVINREKMFGEDQPWIVNIAVRLPKVGFFKKFKFAWEYLKYDGTDCDVELTLDKINAITAFLSNSMATTLVVKQNRFDGF